jgi:hypothetical protein
LLEAILGRTWTLVAAIGLKLSAGPRKGEADGSTPVLTTIHSERAKLIAS